MFTNIILTSCANDLDLKVASPELFIGEGINGFIAIKAYSSNEKVFLLDLKTGNLRDTVNFSFPKFPKLSHQSTSSWNGYPFLPIQDGYEYAGPQLMSPNSEFTVASYISDKGSHNVAKAFVVVENRSKKMIHKETLLDNASVELNRYAEKTHQPTHYKVIPFRYNIP